MRHRRTKNILVNGRRDRAANKGGMTDSGHGRTNRGSKKRAGNRRKLPRKVGQRQYKREQLILDLPAPKKGATVAHHLHVGQKKKGRGNRKKKKRKCFRRLTAPPVVSCTPPHPPTHIHKSPHHSRAFLPTPLPLLSSTNKRPPSRPFSLGAWWRWTTLRSTMQGCTIGRTNLARLLVVRRVNEVAFVVEMHVADSRHALADKLL